MSWWLITQTMLWAVVWYLWMVRGKYLQQMKEALPDPVEYRVFLLMENYYLKVVTSFVVVLSVSEFVVKTWDLFQYFKYSGLPHVY